MPRVSSNKQNFHVPLSPEVYERLKLEAQHLQRPATEVARVAIEKQLHLIERSRIELELQAFIDDAAGSEADFDTVIASAGAEVILAETVDFEADIPENLRQELGLATR
jgi:predicted DNA-binding protein